MSEPYVGEILMFGGNFAPVGWAFCNGEPQAISQNNVLFNLIGTTYGGDGQETFNLPNIQSRIPIHMGQGSGLSNYTLAETGGVESVTLTVNQIPAHSHVPLAAANGTGQVPSPKDAFWANDPSNSVSTYFNTSGGAPSLDPMATNLVMPAGGSQPHENMQPFLAVNFCISLFGIYPSQT